MYVLAACAIIGFATTLVDESRQINQHLFEKHHNNSTSPDYNKTKAEHYRKNVEMLDTASFWCFMAGIWKDHRVPVKRYYELTYGLLFIGLMFERQAINWLTNRWGCNFMKLQKFVELDTRAKAISEKWSNVPDKIPYGLDRYEQHYFYNDYKNY